MEADAARIQKDIDAIKHRHEEHKGKVDQIRATLEKTIEKKEDKK
jgi:hypothetical protein